MPPTTFLSEVRSRRTSAPRTVPPDLEAIGGTIQRGDGFGLTLEAVPRGGDLNGHLAYAIRRLQDV